VRFISVDLRGDEADLAIRGRDVVRFDPKGDSDF
jgi:hypothetical protein